MALKLQHIDETTGANYPAAHWRVDYYLDRGPKEGAWIFAVPYADAGARQAGKAPLSGVRREAHCRNWVEYQAPERPLFASVVGQDETMLSGQGIADLDHLAAMDALSLAKTLRQGEAAADETLTERLTKLVAAAQQILATPPTEIPHNDYDDFFGDDVFMKGGTTPMRQAYAFVKTRPEWAGATDV
jgi:hypothetical protein